MTGPEPLDACDIAVIGGGPAALSLAGAVHAHAPEADLRIFSGQSLDTLHFENNYGAFADAVPAPLRAATVCTYPNTHIAFADAPVRVLKLPYLRFDNKKLVAALLGPLAHVRCSPSRVEHLVRVTTPEGDGYDVITEEHGSVRAKMVIDASGSASPFLHRQGTSGPPLLQRAYGHIVRSSRPLYDENAMRLMDFAPAPPPARGDKIAAPPYPTFAYAMPLEPDGDTHRVFVEETQLAGAEATGFNVLEQALRRRISTVADARGAKSLEVEDSLIERCHILMNAPLPTFEQDVLGFGAAASFVNPASGYSMGTTLTRAERVGAAIGEWWARPAEQRPPTYTLWSSVWTDDELKAHDFYTKGGAIIASFNQRDLIRFNQAFFSLDDDACFRFLNRQMKRSELFNCGFAMAKHFSFGFKARFLSRFAKETARSAQTQRD